MNKALRILLILIAAAPLLLAQGPIGDADGKSSLILQGGGLFSVNVAEKSANIGYVRANNIDPLRVGYELKAKATDGVSAIFDGDRIVPETTARLSLGWQKPLYKTPEEAAKGPQPGDKRLVNWSTLQLGYTRGNYSLYDGARAVGKRAFEEAKDLPQITVYHNRQFPDNVLLGLSAGWERATNYEDLKKVKVVETTIVDSSGATTTSKQKTIDAREGVLESFGQVSLNGDLLWYPSFAGNRLAFDLLIRTTVRHGKTKVSPGFGILALKDGKPTRATGAITFQHDPDKNDLKVGFAAGYPF